METSPYMENPNYNIRYNLQDRKNTMYLNIVIVFLVMYIVYYLYCNHYKYLYDLCVGGERKSYIQEQIEILQELQDQA